MHRSKKQMTSKVTIMSWVGLDVSKETFDAALYLPLAPGDPPRDVMTLPKASFSRTVDGVKAFLDWTFPLREKAGLPGGEMRVAMESTGHYSSELAGWLSQESPFTHPAVEDAKAIHDYAKSLKLRHKTDRIDAGIIARYGYERMPKAYVELPEAYRCLRELTRQRSAVKDQTTQARERLAELKEFPTIIKIQQEVVAALEAAVAKLELEIKRCVEHSDELRQDVEKAVTVPGVALITATTILGECGPLRHYTSRELSAYSGLSPVLQESGTSVRGSWISRRGPSRLRRCLYMSTSAAMQSNPVMQAFHHRLVAKGKKPLQAHCAVMRKLLIMVRAVVVSGVEYQEKFRGNRLENA
jgi:transposase